MSKSKLVPMNPQDFTDLILKMGTGVRYKKLYIRPPKGADIKCVGAVMPNGVIYYPNDAK